MSTGWFTGWSLNTAITETLQKRLLTFLLRKAVGQFLAEELDLNNLEVQLGNGFLQLRELQLNVEVLNELFTDLPFSIASGKIGGITARIPWTTFWKQEYVLEIDSLQLILVPEQAKPRNAKSAPEDSHILSSSIHFAGDFLQNELPAEADEALRNSIYQSFHNSASFVSDNNDSNIMEQSQTFTQQGEGEIEGIQVLASFIDNIIASVKVVFKDTLIRLHHQSTILPSEHMTSGQEQLRDYYFDLELPEISYKDETLGMTDESQPEVSNVTLSAKSKMIKHLSISGLSIWLREELTAATRSSDAPQDTTFFNSSLATSSIHLDPQSLDKKDNIFLSASEFTEGHDSGDEYYDAHDNEYMPDNGNKEAKSYEALLFHCKKEGNWARVTVRQNAPPPIHFDNHNASASYYNTQEAMQQSNITQSYNIECFIEALTGIMTPGQASLLSDLLNALIGSDSEVDIKPSSAAESDDDIILHTDNKYTSSDYHTTKATSNLPHVLHQKPSSFKTHQQSSSYNMSNSVSSHSANVQSTASYNQSGMNFKLELRLIELFFLYNDPILECIPGRDTFEKRQFEESHLKADVHSCVLSVSKRMSDDNLYNKRRTGSTSSGSFSYGQHKNSDLEEASSISFNLTISDFYILEALKGHSRQRSSVDIYTQSNASSAWKYYPVLQFDSNLEKDSGFEGHDYPVENIRSNSEGKSWGGNKHTDHGVDSAVIRVDMRYNEEEAVNISTANPSPQLRRDIIIELEPLEIYLNLWMIDRMSKYINGIAGSINRVDKLEEDKAQTLFASSIIDDLDVGSSEDSSIIPSRLEIRNDLIRFWLICPDMSSDGSCEHGIRSDFIIIDVIEMNILTPDVRSGRIARPYTFGHSDTIETVANSIDENQTRVKIECHSAKVYLKNDKTENILTVEKLASDDQSLTPNILITYRPVSSVTSKRAPNGSFPSTPFAKTFTSFEGEERVKWHPSESEEEEMLNFKHRTIERSIFVFNCFFPFTRADITKQSYDTLLLLLNDISIWQQPNIGQTGNDTSSSLTPTEHSFAISGFETHIPLNLGFEDVSLNEDTLEPRQRAGEEFIGIAKDAKPSLASLVVSMANAEIKLLCDATGDIQTTSKRSYQFDTSEFRFFAVINYEGENVTYICVDNDDFTLSDTSNSREKTQILQRTIAKEIKTKNTHPMSLIIMGIFFDQAINYKETKIAFSVNGVTLKYTMTPMWIEDFSNFVQEPTMIPYTTMTSHTKLLVNINDSSIYYKPENLASRIVFVVENVKVSSRIIPESPTFSCKVVVQNMDMVIVDDVKSLSDRIINRVTSDPLDVKTYWKEIGFAHAAALDFANIAARIKRNIYPYLELKLTDENLTIETCADTFQTILQLLNHISATFSAPDKKDKKSADPTTYMSVGDGITEALEGSILDEIDENAFKYSKPKTIKSRTPKNHSKQDNLNQDVIYFDEEFFEKDEPRDRPDNNDEVFESKAVREFDGGLEDSENVKGLEDFENKLTWVTPYEIEYKEDHFAAPTVSELEAAEGQKKSLMRVRIRDFNVIWKLYDGYDWENTRTEVLDRLARAKAQAEMLAEASKDTGEEMNKTVNTETSSFFEQIVTGTPFRHSEYDTFSQATSEIDFMDDHSETASQFGSKTDTDNHCGREGRRSNPIHRPTRPKLSRSRSSKLDIILEKISLDFDSYPEDDQVGFRLLVYVKEIEILDKIKTSGWGKFMSHMRSADDRNLYETKSKMVRVELKSVRPTPSDSEELRLKVRLLPLRFHIDQDALNFLIRFFSFQDRSDSTPNTEDDTYFQYFEIQPVVMKIDYKPKHVDYTNLKEGNLVELMNFFHLEAAEMTLRDVTLTGVKGWRRLIEDLGAAWLPHITNTQVSNVLSGVAPIRSLVNIGSGVVDLILLPVEQYKKDGRIIRGLQKGTQSFAKATTMEAIKLGTKLAVGTQVMLEHADEILSFNSDDKSGRGASMSTAASEDDSDDDNQEGKPSKYAQQPADINEGIEAAYKSLRQNIGTAAHTIFAVPMEVYEKTGAQGSAKAVIKAVPVAVLKPMIGASEAVSKTLLGLRNTIDPNQKLEMEDKYKRRT
ncbi:4609_t:CDS:10 [Paraglomus occultum]|uniref:Autophagy-related protein 2 n=1 Tax=Paraglomus occultum TaxID=144539 RepID=A0A9N8W668_9GLOM|nr:4609_t:CDS:10 [Paraglomus occultum]